MTNIWKRSLSLFLAVVMVFGMLPVNAFATDGQNGDNTSDAGISATAEGLPGETGSTGSVDPESMSVEGEDTNAGNGEGEDTNAGNGEGEDTDAGNGEGEDTDAGNGEGEDTDAGNGEGEDTDAGNGNGEEANAGEEGSESAGAEEELKLVEQTVQVDWDLATDEELFQMYAEQQLYGTDWSFFGTAAGELLEGNDKLIYDAVIPFIQEIASGERADTSITLGQASLTNEDVTYTADKVMEFVEGDASVDNILKALLADLPYEMYWFDKTQGFGMPGFTSGGKLVQVTLEFVVNTAYSNGDSFTVDTAKTGAASAAAANAQDIVDRYKNASDYEKLVGYKEEICDLVTYDDDAADAVPGSTFQEDNNPWHIINVFDNNTTTNVVCEGYSKAFQYLCDLTTFSNETIECYNVSGTMAGGTGAGAHMWNIVTIDDNNYLVDVTNSDEGSIGQDGTLFLAGTTNGSVSEGYTFTNTNGNDITFTYEVTYKNENGETVTEPTTAPWGTNDGSILILASEDYTVPAEGGEETTLTLDAVREALSEGAYTLTEHFEISGEEVLTVPSGATLTVQASLGLNDDAKLIVEDGGSLIIAENASVDLWGNAAFTAASLTNNGTLFLNEGSADIAAYDGTGKINYFGAASLTDASVTVVGKGNIRRYYIVENEASFVSALTEEGTADYANFGVYINADITLTQEVEIPAHAEVVLGYMSGGIGLTIQNNAGMRNCGRFRINNNTTLSVMPYGQLINDNDLQNMGEFVNAGLITNNGTILNNKTTTPGGELAGELTNNGTIMNNGTLSNKGTLTNNGAISGNAVENEGTFTDNAAPEDVMGDAEFAAAMAESEGGYTLTKSVEISGEVTIDRFVEVPTGLSLTVLDNAKLINHGYLKINGGTMTVKSGATVENTNAGIENCFGVITFENRESYVCDSDWPCLSNCYGFFDDEWKVAETNGISGERIKLSGSAYSEEDIRAIIEAFENADCRSVEINAENVTISEDLTIPQKFQVFVGSDGSWDNFMTIHEGVTVTNYGELSSSANEGVLNIYGDVVNYGAMFINDGGTINLDGSITGTGALHVGFINEHNYEVPGTLNINGTLTTKGYLNVGEKAFVENYGTVTLQGGTGMHGFLELGGEFSNRGTFVNNAGNGEASNGGIVVKNNATFRVYSDASLTSTGDVVVEGQGFLSNRNGLIDMKAKSTLFHYGSIENGEKGTFNVYGTYQRNEHSGWFLNDYVEDSNGTAFMGTVNGMNKKNLTLMSNTQNASLRGMIANLGDYGAGQYMVSTALNLYPQGTDTVLGIPGNFTISVQNAMTVEKGLTLFNEGRIEIWEGGSLTVKGTLLGNEPDVMGGEYYETAPYLSFAWISDNGEKFYVEEDQDNRGMTARPGDHMRIVLYYNTWDAYNLSWNRQLVYPGNLTVEGSLAAKSFAAMAQEDEYYNERPLEGVEPGQATVLCFTDDLSAWDTVAKVSYMGVSMEIPIQRNEDGFYTAPEATNANWVNYAELDPLKGEYVFYFIFESDYWELDGSLASGNIRVEEGGEYVTVSDAGNGIIKCTVAPEFVANMWNSSGGYFELGYNVRAKNDPQHTEEWHTGIQLGTKWPDAPDASIVINDENYNYYRYADKYMTWREGQREIVELPEGVSYDIASNTLTLNNANVENLEFGYAWFDEEQGVEIHNLPNENLTLNLVGNNTVTSNYRAPLAFSDGLNVTITGDGSLHLNAITEEGATYEDTDNLWVTEAIWCSNDSSLTIAGNAKVTAEVIGNNHFEDGTQAHMVAVHSDSATLTLKDNATLTTILPEDARGNGDKRIVNEYGDVEYPGGYQGLENFSNLLIQDNAVLNTSEIYVGEEHSFTQQGGTVNITSIGLNGDREVWENDEVVETVPFEHSHYNGIWTDGGTITIQDGTLNISVQPTAEEAASSSYFFGIQARGGVMNLSGGTININGAYGGAAVFAEEDAHLRFNGSILNHTNTSDEFSAIVEVNHNATADFSGGIINADKTDILLRGPTTWNGTMLEGSYMFFRTENEFTMYSGEIALKEGSAFISTAMTEINGGKIDLNYTTMYTETGFAFNDGTISIVVDEGYENVSAALMINGYFSMGGGENPGNPQLIIKTVDIPCIVTDVMEREDTFLNGMFHQMGGEASLYSERYPAFINRGNASLFGGVMNAKGNIGFMSEYARGQEQGVLITEDFVLNATGTGVGFAVKGPTYWNGGQVNARAEGDANTMMPAPFALHVGNNTPDGESENVSFLEINGGEHTLTSIDTGNGERYSKGIAIDHAPLRFKDGSVRVEAEMALYSMTHDQNDTNINAGVSTTYSGLNIFSLDSQKDLTISSRLFTETTDDEGDWFHSVYEEDESYASNVLITANETVDTWEFINMMNSIGEDEELWLEKSVDITQDVELTRRVRAPRGVRLFVTNGATLTIPAHLTLTAGDEGIILVDEGAKIENYGTVVNAYGIVSFSEDGYVPVDTDESEASIRDNYHYDAATKKIKFCTTTGVDKSEIIMAGEVENETQVRAAITAFSGKGYKKVEVNPNRVTISSSLTVPEDVVMNVGGRYIEDDEGNRNPEGNVLTIGSKATLTVNGDVQSVHAASDINVNGKLILNGTMFISDGGTLNVNGSMTNYGNLHIGMWAEPEHEEVPGILNISGTMDNYGYLNVNGTADVYGKLNNATKFATNDEAFHGFIDIRDVLNVYGILNNSNWIVVGYTEEGEIAAQSDGENACLYVHSGATVNNNPKSDADAAKDPGNTWGSIRVLDYAEMVIDGTVNNNALLVAESRTQSTVTLSGLLVNDGEIDLDGSELIANGGRLENNFLLWVYPDNAKLDMANGEYVVGTFLNEDGSEQQAWTFASYAPPAHMPTIRGIDNSLISLNGEATDYDFVKATASYQNANGYYAFQIWMEEREIDDAVDVFTIPAGETFTIPENSCLVVKDGKTLVVEGQLLNHGALEVMMGGRLIVEEGGWIGNSGEFIGYEESYICNRGIIENHFSSDSRIEFGDVYDHTETGVLQLSMIDGETGTITGNVGRDQMTLWTCIDSESTGLEQLHHFIGKTIEEGFDAGIVRVETKLTVTGEVVIPENITVQIGNDSDNLPFSIYVPDGAFLVLEGDINICNGSELKIDGIYVQANKTLTAKSGATVTVNGVLNGGDTSEMIIEENATLNNNNYMSCGIMPVTVNGNYVVSEGAVLEMAYLDNGEGYKYVGEAEGLDNNSQVTLFHPLRSEFPNHDDETILDMLAVVEEGGYAGGLISILGVAVEMDDLTIPENVELRIWGRNADADGNEINAPGSLTLNNLMNEGTIVVNENATLTVNNTMSGNAPQYNNYQTDLVMDFSQLKTMISHGRDFIEIGGHVVATSDFTIPSGITVRVNNGGTLEIASGVTVNLVGQLWTSREGGSLIVRPGATIDGGTIMVRTGSLTNQGTITSELTNVTFAKNQTELINAVTSGVDVVRVVGNYSLTKSLTIPEGKILIVDPESTLTINTTGTIENNGTFQVKGTLNYIRGKLTGNRIVVDGGELVNLPENNYVDPDVKISNFILDASTYEATVGSEIEIYVAEYEPLNAADFKIELVEVTGAASVKETTDRSVILEGTERGTVTVTVKAVDEDGNDLGIEASTTVEFYQQHIEMFNGDGSRFVDDRVPNLPQGLYLPISVVIMDGPYIAEDHADIEINRTGTDVVLEAIEGAEFVTITKKNGVYNVAGKLVTEPQTVKLRASAVDGSAESRVIELKIIPLVQKVDIQLNGQSVSGKTIKNDNTTNSYLDFTAVMSPDEANSMATWMLSDTTAAHFVDANGDPIYDGENTEKLASFIWDTECRVEFTAVKTVKLTALANDASNKSAVVTIMATEMPSRLVAVNPVESMIGGQSATYQVRGFYGDPENADDLANDDLYRNNLPTGTTGVTWSLVDDKGNPIASHPYATLSAAGKLSTKTVAEKQSVHMLAKFDGAAEESNLLMTVDLYPAVSKVDAVYNSEIVTGGTVMVDLADTTSINTSLDIYPYAGSVKSIEWKSSSAAIAVVEPITEDSEGKPILATNADIKSANETGGTVTITATLTAWNNTKKTVTFKVKFAKLTNDITFDITASSDEDAYIEGNQVFALNSGKYVTLTGTAWDKNNAAIENVGVTWALENSADKTYLTVTAAGKLTANTVYHPTWVNVVASSKDGAYKETVTVEIQPKLDTALYIWTADNGVANYVTKTTVLSEASTDETHTIALYANADENETLTWTSSKPAVAMVDKETGVVTVLTAGTATITAKATNNEDDTVRTATVNVKGTKVSRFTEITDKSGNAEGLVVASGKTLDLVGTVTYSDDTTNKTVTWSLTEVKKNGVLTEEDPAKYAKISTAGRITATANLTETVTVVVSAKATDGMSEAGTAEVTIQPLATAVTIYGPFGDGKTNAEVTNLTKVWNMGADDISNLNSYENTMISLSAEVLSMTGKADASQTVKWTSSNASVAAIDAESGAITCQKAGTVTITATAQDGSGKKATFKLTIVKEMLRIDLDAGSAKVAGGKKLTIKATAFPSDTTNKKMAWSVTGSNAVYATITSSGVLTAKTVTAPMEVTVRAEALDGSGVVAEIPVTIYPLTTSVQIHEVLPVEDGEEAATENVTGKTIYVDVNGNVNLSAVAVPSSAMGDYTWTSSNKSYATVDENGVVHGIAAGKTATITATAQDGSGKKATVKVTVIEPVQSIALEDNLILAGSKSLKLANYVTFEPENPTIKTLNWEIEPGEGDAYATINPTTGELKAKAIEVEQFVTVKATATDGTGEYTTTTIKLYPMTTKLDIEQIDEVGNRTTVTGKTLTLYVGDSMNLHGLTTPAGASQDWHWTSSASSYAEVDPVNGTVQALKGGKTVTITAAAKDGSGKKATVKIKTVQLMEGLTFSADNYDLAAGKSLTLKPTVDPSDTANKALTWEIVKGGEYATISSSGVVKAKNVTTTEENEVPTVLVRATAKDGSGVVAECTIRIYPLTKKLSITNDEDSVVTGTLPLYVTQSEDGVHGELQLGALTEPFAASQEWTWTSSNKAYAEVDENGLVTAKQVGKTVTITVKATDGSGKSASIKVQTIQLMENLEITSTSDVLGSGKKLTLKTVVEPANTTNKAVTWSLLNEEDKAFASISTSGVLTAKTITEPTLVTVQAEAKDISKTTDTFDVMLYPVTTKMLIRTDIDGVATNVTGKTLELKLTGNSEDGFNSEKLSLTCLTTPENAAQEWTWTSSNKNYVDFDEDGYVIGKVPGKTVTITAKAKDGSGKSATVKVKTIQLMTGLEITNENPVLASGKSITLKTAVTPATTTNKAVTWKVLPNADGNTYATITTAGVLKAKTVQEETPIKVQATAKDGSEVYAECDVYLYPATTKLQLETMIDGESTSVSGKTITLYVRQGLDEAIGQPNDTMDLTVLTTPANACGNWTFSSSASGYATVSETGRIEAVKGGKTVTITAKATDGTGKTATVKVKTVQLMTGLEITNENPVLASGKSITLKTSISPSNTANKKLRWEITEGEEYATVSSTGVLKAKTVDTIQTVKVQATAQDGSEVAAETTVTIYPEVTTKVSITVGSGDAAAIQKVEIGGTIKLGSQSFPEAAAQVWAWTSSNNAVATVEADGTVTGHKAGTVTITCKAVDGSGKSATVKVQVVKPET